MGRTYPTPSARYQNPERGFLVCGGRGVWTSPLGFDRFVRNESGQPKGWPGARSAEGEAQGWAEHIPPLPPHTKTPKGVFWYVAEGVCGRAHSGSTDSSGTNLDSRRAGPERAARRVRPKDGPNISQPVRQIPKPRKGFFGMWRKGCVDEPTRVRRAPGL